MTKEKPKKEESFEVYNTKINMNKIKIRKMVAEQCGFFGYTVEEVLSDVIDGLIIKRMNDHANAGGELTPEADAMLQKLLEEKRKESAKKERKEREAREKRKRMMKRQKH